MHGALARLSHESPAAGNGAASEEPGIAAGIAADVGAAAPQDAPPRGYELRPDLPPLRPRFLKLYRAFQEGQWHPDDGSIDWSRAPVVEDLFVFRHEATELRAYFIADFYYGEEFTLRGAGRRLDALDQMDEKLCYALMIVDEHRHAEVFGRYQRALGVIREPDPRLCETLRWAEELDVEAFTLGAFILEVIAVHAMPAMWRSTRDPLLGAFLPRVHKDESRHEAFSHLYLQSRAPRWSPARRRALSDLAAQMFRRQESYMLERNPLIPFAIPRAMSIGLDLLARRSLRSGARTLARRMADLDLAIPAELARWT